MSHLRRDRARVVGRRGAVPFLAAHRHGVTDFARPLGLSNVVLISLLKRSPDLTTAPTATPIARSSSIIMTGLFHRVNSTVHDINRVMRAIGAISSLLRRVANSSGKSPRDRPPATPRITDPTPTATRPSQSTPSRRTVITRILRHSSTPCSYKATNKESYRSFRVAHHILPSNRTTLVCDFCFGNAPASFVSESRPSNRQSSIGHCATLLFGSSSSPETRTRYRINSVNDGPCKLINYFVHGKTNFVCLDRRWYSTPGGSDGL